MKLSANTTVSPFFATKEKSLYERLDELSLSLKLQSKLTVTLAARVIDVLIAEPSVALLNILSLDETPRNEAKLTVDVGWEINLAYTLPSVATLELFSRDTCPECEKLPQLLPSKL